ncbi:MipA/OmpV family protein [Vibrio sp. RE86]|uniref:MipA/OmpV family protein n=1 Tax=Vibrio sp. RE86 TaxID=2607605 RepID=UPI001493DB0A|nr:MipA/OmpV family protein [Vibrio sp. RE86]NOH81007.1 MipA/OmpV family protein [Vibrio sp. RE86]
MNKYLYAIALILPWSTTAFAEDKYYDFGFVGASATYGQSVFTDGNKAQASLEPNLFYNGKYGFVDGSLVNISILPYVGFSGNWRFSEVSNDFDDLPDGINDRDGNGELGLTIGTVGARVTFLHDVTDQHDGYEVQLHLGHTLDLPFEQLTFTPYIEIDYRDSKLSRHLYSISAQEATQSHFDSFEADETWVYQAGLISIYDITQDWLGLAKLEVQHHDSNSPIIQRDLGWNISLGIVYKFTD